MAPIQKADISFSHSKSCFIQLPKKWIVHDLAFQDITIFKIEYDNNRKAYFSCKGVSSSSLEEHIQLNGKYALSLGLKDKEQVFVQQVEGNIVHAEKVYLEPVNSDDWEISELNAQTIETDLLNQIRVVWKDQVFPVWAHNTSFHVKVVQLEPEVEPVLLVEWTEVHLIPKERNFTQSQTTSEKQRRIDMAAQYDHLRKRRKKPSPSHPTSPTLASDEVDSDDKPGTFSLPVVQPSPPTIRPAFSLFRYVMKTVFQNESLQSLQSRNQTFPPIFIPLNITLRLRVIAFSKPTTDHLALALQATTVFISDRTFQTLCDMYPIPNCFVATLSKLPSPDEMKEKQQAVQPLNVKDKSRKKKNEKNSGSIEKSTILDSVYVNVVVLQSMKEEFEAPLALFMNRNFIAVPLELKRRLGLEVSSCVSCQSVDKPPILFKSIICHPLESLKPNFDDVLISAAFHKWIEDANLEGSSVVLGDGTLVKLNISQERSCDFIIYVLPSEDSVDAPSSSPSSLNNVSLSSTESEKIASIFPGTLNYGFLNYENIQNLQIQRGAFFPQLSKAIWCYSSSLHKVESLYQSLPALSLEALGGVKKIAAEAMIDFELWFHLTPLTVELSGYTSTPGCMLIHGPKGVGKTTLLKALCKNLMNHPYFIFISIIECLPLRGKRVETISKKWDAVLAEAAHRQPSLIIFEDLDKLASAPITPEQEAGPDAIYFSSVAQTFITLTKKIMDNKACIVIAATSKSIHSLYPSLTSSEGRHVFQSILEIKPPTLEHRFEMLQSLVLSKLHIAADSLQTFDWQNLARVAEGYVAQDLESLVDRATHAAFVRTNFVMENRDGNDQISLIYEDFETALANYTPSTLRGLQLQHGNAKTWKDVGGLQQVKEAIEETLIWPTQYKELFKDFHLRLQTNILLYGVPGTGKTLIAGVVASECGLNFISIKGPELLSKYIGASEQAVRDLFARAASAKPCVLFFDEFDALAPQRGHDSTGVTDRVVNQLLTQMDGVENLEGVYILAATSRPELIDPALLRPGRFDKCLECPLPNDSERLEILNALSLRLALSDDVDFEAIVPLTKYFSGADLQALLYSAQIEALHETQVNRSRRCSISGDEMELPIGDRIVYMPTLEQGAVEPSIEVANEILQEMNTLFSNISPFKESESSSRRRGSTISFAVEQKHLLKIISEMKPSVSAEERMRYEIIFQKFKKTPASGFSAPDKFDNRRVTLA